MQSKGYFHILFVELEKKNVLPTHKTEHYSSLLILYLRQTLLRSFFSLSHRTVCHFLSFMSNSKTALSELLCNLIVLYTCTCTCVLFVVYVHVYMYVCMYIATCIYILIYVLQEPVILTDTDLVASALHWDLSYLEQNMGPAKHTVYVSKTQTFMYFDDRKVSIIT